MKDLFSGNVDLIAVAVLILTVGIGSAIHVERHVAGHAGERIVKHTRIVVFDRQIMEAAREGK